MLTDKRLFLPLGFLALTLSVLLNRIGTDLFPHVAFIEGVLLGISTVLAVAGIVAAGSATSHER